MGERAAVRDEVLRLVEQARSLTPSTRPADLPPTAVIKNVPAWHNHEHAIWELGEQARQRLAEQPRLRADVELYRTFLPLIADRAAGRGRQSWVTLFEFTGCAPFANEVAALLSDPDVEGHAVEALTKMNASGHAAEVVPLLDSRQAWIRKSARRYVSRFSPDER